MPLVSLDKVSKIYRSGAIVVPAATEISLQILPNCFTVISGPSGSGKTTLLNLIGCIDTPDSGNIRIEGRSVNTMTDNEISDFRARHLGFIFQNFNLLPVLTAYENIEYPLLLARVPKHERRQRVLALLEEVGLADKANSRPTELSGGQRQRVAIARALAASPKLILADEPTANLDSETGATIIALMRKMQREHEVSFVFSSHDPKVLAEADDSFFIRDGRLTAARLPDAAQ